VDKEAFRLSIPFICVHPALLKQVSIVFFEHLDVSANWCIS